MGILSTAFEKYRLRLRRRRYLVRALRKRRELTQLQNRTAQISPLDLLVFSTVRNEVLRLPYFLQHYRDMGVNHFFFVDNASDDGTAEYLQDQPDVSIWSTQHSYKRSRFGVDWLNWLMMRYANGHWCLTVDADELFIYPFHDTRPLRALTDWLDDKGIPSFGALMLDLYPKGRLDEATYHSSQNPTEVLTHFDAGNYTFKKHHKLHNLWIQGGVRSRVFFADKPRRGPSLNKTPLVKWHWRYAYVSSTHSLLPRSLNLVYDQAGGEKTTGVLLHTKFLPIIAEKSAEELERGQHFGNSEEYIAYHKHLADNPVLWSPASTEFEGWRQLEVLGLMSKGDWV